MVSSLCLRCLLDQSQSPIGTDLLDPERDLQISTSSIAFALIAEGHVGDVQVAQLLLLSLLRRRVYALEFPQVFHLVPTHFVGSC